MTIKHAGLLALGLLALTPSMGWAASFNGAVFRQANAAHHQTVPQGKLAYLKLAASMKPASLPLALVDAVITKESNYNPNARGRAGEIGLMQIKPSTARTLGNYSARDLYHPATNLKIGMTYLAQCWKRAGGNRAATIGCYNAGPGNMWAWSKIPHTRAYVNFVNMKLADAE